jgi:formylmethanofuran dehydrogenase subunit E-like metal-binding protein
MLVKRTVYECKEKYMFTDIGLCGGKRNAWKTGLFERTVEKSGIEGFVGFK